VRRSAARQRPPPIAEISCAKVSSCCSTSLRTDLWYLRVSRQQHTLIFFCVDGLRCPLLARTGHPLQPRYVRRRGQSRLNVLATSNSGSDPKRQSYLVRNRCCRVAKSQCRKTYIALNRSRGRVYADRELAAQAKRIGPPVVAIVTHVTLTWRGSRYSPWWLQRSSQPSCCVSIHPQ
jgi:hypothetical protein